MKMQIEQYVCSSGNNSRRSSDSDECSEEPSPETSFETSFENRFSEPVLNNRFMSSKNNNNTRQRSSSFGENLLNKTTTVMSAFADGPLRSSGLEVFPKSSWPMATMQRSQTMDDQLFLLQNKRSALGVKRNVCRSRQTNPGRFRTAPIFSSSSFSIDEEVIREVDEEEFQFPSEPVPGSGSGSTDDSGSEDDAGSSCSDETGSGLSDNRSLETGCTRKSRFESRKNNRFSEASRSSPASLSSSPQSRSSFVLPASALRLNTSHLFNSGANLKAQHHRSFESLSQLRLGLLLPPIPEERRGANSQNLTSPLSPTPSCNLPPTTPVLVSQQSCPSFDVSLLSQPANLVAVAGEKSSNEIEPTITSITPSTMLTFCENSNINNNGSTATITAMATITTTLKTNAEAHVTSPLHGHCSSNNNNCNNNHSNLNNHIDSIAS